MAIVIKTKTPINIQVTHKKPVELQLFFTSGAITSACKRGSNKARNKYGINFIPEFYRMGFSRLPVLV